MSGHQPRTDRRPREVHGPSDDRRPGEVHRPRDHRPGARGWSQRTLRARITVLATLVVALAVAGSGLLAVRVLGYVLARTVDDGARTQAAEIAALVQRGELPDPLPALGSTAGVQVVDGAGRVLAASAGGDRLSSIVAPGRLAAVRAGVVVDLPGARLGGPEPLRVVGVAADTAGQRRTVLVAVSFLDVSRSVHLVGVAVLVGSPLAVGAFALSCWLLTGSALRPVEVLRRGAGEISDAGSAQRLPLPVAHDEIRLLAETLNAMLDRLTVAAVAQRTFVADAAHELRSPLASLRVQLEVERDHPDALAWPATADDLLADVARLERLVTDLLTLARAEQPAGRRQEAGDLVALSRAIAADAVAARPGIDLRVTSAAGEPPPAARGDPDALRRVVTNLVANALAHARNRVVLAVGAVPGAGGMPRVALVVSDDGPGIPLADRARVFDRFTRLDSARAADGGGAGLGLSIVARLVAAHHGTVTLADSDIGSASDPGLSVTVELPVAPVPGGPGAADDRAAG